MVDELPNSLAKQGPQEWSSFSGRSSHTRARYRVADAAEALAACDYDVFVTSTNDYPALTYLMGYCRCGVDVARPGGSSNEEGSCAPRTAGAVVPGDIDDLVFLPELVDSDKVDGLRTLKLETNKMVKAYKARGEMLAATDLRVGTTASLVRALTETVGSAVQLPNGYDDDGWRNSQEALANVRNDGVIRNWLRRWKSDAPEGTWRWWQHPRSPGCCVKKPRRSPGSVQGIRRSSGIP